jgi:hypothetical protein
MGEVMIRTFLLATVFLFCALMSSGCVYYNVAMPLDTDLDVSLGDRLPLLRADE